MLSCSFTNGKWQSPEILPYGPISFNPGLQVLHYGQSVFEGRHLKIKIIKFYYLEKKKTLKD